MTRRTLYVGASAGALGLLVVLLMWSHEGTASPGEPGRRSPAVGAGPKGRASEADASIAPTALAPVVDLGPPSTVGDPAPAAWESPDWSELRLGPDPMAIHGRVLGPAGQPVVGARLTLLDAAGRVASRGDSGPAGAFRLLVDAWRVDVWQGRLVSVVHPDHPPTRVRLSATAATSDIVLRPSRVLRVAVHFDDGRPARGAVLDLLVPGGYVPYEDVARTDARGEALLVLPVSTARGRWRVYHPESRTTTLDVTLTRAELGQDPRVAIERELDLRLGARPTVRIESGLRERGRLGRKGEIRLVPLEMRGHSVHDPRAPIHGDVAVFPGTDDVRLYKAHMPIPGEPYRVEYVDPLETVTLVERWDAVAGETMLEVDLPPPTLYRSDSVTWLLPIRLLDAETGEELDDVTLERAGWRLHDLNYSIRDADSNEQSWPGELGTTGGLDALGRWRPPVVVVLHVGSTESVSAPAMPGDVIEFRIDSEDLARGTGRVRFVVDVPVADARITLRPVLDDDSSRQARVALIGEPTRVPAGTWQYTALAPWRLPVDGMVTVADGDDVEEPLAFEVAGALLIRDPGGTWPRFGGRFTVSLAPPGASRPDRVVTRDVKPTGGALLVDAVPPGSHVLGLWITGPAGAWIAETRVEVVPDRLHRVDLLATPAPTVSVAVTLPDGVSPSSVEASCWSLDGAFVSLWNGEPTWRLPAGRWIVRVSAHPDGAEVRTMIADVRDDEVSPLELMLDPR